MKNIIVFLLLVQIGFSQEINQLDQEGKKHGLWKGFFEDSKRPKYEGVFEHGKEVGVFKFYDNTQAGTVIATRDFNSKDNSCYTIFYNQKKNKVSEGKIVGKKYEGEWKYYYEDSSNVMTIENYENDKLEGVRKVFYKSGKIAEETTYVKGVKNGFYKKYTEDGIVLEESNYKNGDYDGLAIFRGADNQVYGEGMYKEGRKVGMWKIMEKGKMKNVNMNLQGKKFQKRVKPLEED